MSAYFCKAFYFGLINLFSLCKHGNLIITQCCMLLSTYFCILPLLSFQSPLPAFTEDWFLGLSSTVCLVVNAFMTVCKYHVARCFACSLHKDCIVWSDWQLAGHCFTINSFPFDSLLLLLL